MARVMMRPVVIDGGIAIAEASTAKGAVRAARAYFASYGNRDWIIVGAVRDRNHHVAPRDRTYDADDMHGRDVYVLFMHPRA